MKKTTLVMGSVLFLALFNDVISTHYIVVLQLTPTDTEGITR